MKKLTATVLISLCLVILSWAALRANAAWHFYAAQTIAEPLFETSTGPAAAFEESQSHINTALKRFPNNPVYLDFAGRLQILQTGQMGVMGAQRRALLESAADYFRQALAVRPLWPYSWVYLLIAKDKLGQVDREFREALKRSAQHGPWEPQVQLQVIRSGLRYWSSLGSVERAVVQRKVLDALKIQPREVFVVIKDYGRPDLVCGVQNMHVRIKRWCDDVYVPESS